MRVQLGGRTVQPWAISSDGLCLLCCYQLLGAAALQPALSHLRCLPVPPSCPVPLLLYCCCCAAAGFSQQMAKMYNNLGLKMMERRKHDEAMGLVGAV